MFFTPNLGRNWLKVGETFPLVPVTDVHYQAVTNTLFAATFGRSIFSSQIGVD